MVSRSPSARRAQLGLLAVCALLVLPHAQAGMFATETALADFEIAEDQIVYATPALNELNLTLTAENEIQFSISGASVAGEPVTTAGGYDAKLNLGGNLIDGAFTGEFMIFGSIPSAEASDTIVLMEGTLEAMRVNSEGDDILGFLFADKPTSGALATQYQAVGIYAHVAGLDQIEWVNLYDSSASIMNLLAEGDAMVAAGAGAAPAAPAPATILLLLAGLGGLRYFRHRAG